MKITGLLFLVIEMLCHGCQRAATQAKPEHQKFNLYNFDSYRVAADTGVVNTALKRIFVPGRKFTFGYTLKKNGRQYSFAVIAGDSGYPLDWVWIPSDSIVDDRTYVIENVELNVFRNRKKSSRLNSKYLEIGYEFTNQGRRIWQGELTTVSEDSMEVFLHPVRSYGFALTEFNPFPFVKFPLQTGQRWRRILTFPNTHFAKAKVKNDLASEFSNANMEYKVTGDVNVSTRMGIIPCKKIEASAELVQGVTFATFYFSEQWGFVKTEYRNLDGSELVFQLTGVQDLE